MNKQRKFMITVTYNELGIVIDTKAEEVAQPADWAKAQDYTELKQEFIRMASYIDVLLECSDEQKETLVGFISRLSEHMPWTERD